MKQIYKAEMEADELYVGDVCYALDDTIYDEVWGKQMNYQDGVIELDGNACAVAIGTEIGDGVFMGLDRIDGHDHLYPVDAGNIGVTNLKYGKEDEAFCGGTFVEIKTGHATIEASRTDKGTIGIKIYDGEKLVFHESIKTF